MSPGMLTHVLTLANPAGVHTSWQSPALSCRLPCSVYWSVLPPSLHFPTSLFCLGPSFPRPLPVSWEISRASSCCGFAPKETKESSDWHLPTPTEMNATRRVPMYKKWAQARLKLLSTKRVYKSLLIYLYKKDLALDNKQWLNRHKTKPMFNQLNEKIIQDFNVHMYLDCYSVYVPWLLPYWCTSFCVTYW